MILLMALFLIVACTVLLIPVLVLLVQSVMAYAALAVSPILTARRPRIAILVPAHNEEAGIAATVDSLLPQMQDGDRIVVIADNCSDGTADVAWKAGAEVRERNDPTHRGKGYALDFGIRSLADNPPEVLITVDADCLVTPGSVDRLARSAIQSGRPVQALNLMHAPQGCGPMKKIAEFAWIVKNLARPLGYHRLGLPCQLMGTGMAFPWQVIRSVSLANGNIAEDIKLGVDLARAGSTALFCPDAQVHSMFPVSAAGTKGQRARWEHGHLSAILSEAPAMFSAGLRQRRPELIALALDLCVPPVALLSLLVFGLLAGTALFAYFTSVMAPLAFALLVTCSLATAILLAWWRYGRQTLSAGNLLMAMFYMLWKVPLYLRFSGHRQVEWVRAERDNK